MRMFAAIDLDAGVKAGLAGAARGAGVDGRASFKFVDPQQAHLTLAFLGEVPSPQCDRIVAAMEAPIGGVAPFHVTFGGLGVFPPRGAPRVLWLGVLEGVPGLTALQQRVARRLEALGVTLEDRAFHPHLTIGRWRRSSTFDRPSLPAEARSIGAMTVDCVTLYESRLSSEGPAHIALAHARLQRL